MTRLAAILFVVAFSAACDRDKASETAPQPAPSPSLMPAQSQPLGPRDAVESFLATLVLENEGRADAMLAGYASDCEWMVATSSEPPLHGREAIRAHWQLHRTAFPDRKTAARRILSWGDRVVAQLVTHGTHEGTFAGFAPTKSKIAYETLEIASMKEGRVLRAVFYLDQGVLLAQLAPGSSDAKPAGPAWPGKPEIIRADPTAFAPGTIEALYAALSSGVHAELERFVAADVVIHERGSGKELRGLPALEERIAAERKAFPDAKAQLDESIGIGTFTVARVTIKGTHKGPLTDPTGKLIAATNKGFIAHGADVIRFENGKVKEIDSYRDSLEIPRQLGILGNKTP